MGFTVTYGSTFVEEPRVISYNTTQGWETRRQWSTAEKADIVNLMNTLKEHGYSFEVTQGPAYKVTASIPGVVLGDTFELDPAYATDVPAPVWELLNGSTDKDLLNSSHLPVINALSKESIENIRRIVKGSDESSGNAKVTAKTKAEIRAANVVKYLMLHGVTSVPVNVPMLRKTETVTDRYYMKPAITENTAGSGKIYTTDELIALEGVPAFMRNALPNPAQRIILEPKTDMVYYYGWLKQNPNVQMIAANRFQVSQEFHYGLWVDWLWGSDAGAFPTLSVN